MEPNSEIQNDLPLSVRGENVVNAIPSFKLDSAASKDSAKNSGRNALRGWFRPLIYFCLEKGQPKSSLSTPELVTAEALGQPELQLNEETKSQLQKRYNTSEPNSKIDWDREAINILLDHTHPLRVISMVAKDRLSEAGKKELTKTLF